MKKLIAFAKFKISINFETTILNYIIKVDLAMKPKPGDKLLLIFNSMISVVFAVIIITSLFPIPSLAQQNLLGNLLGGVISKQVQMSWQNLPQPRQECLLQQLQRNNLNVNNLIQRGIGPDDPRLAQINAPCQQLQNQEKSADTQIINGEQAGDEQQAEEERINAIKAIKLNVNIKCNLLFNDAKTETYCDEKLFSIEDIEHKTPLTVQQAIDGNHVFESVSVVPVERADAENRRKEMGSLYQYFNTVPAPLNINCAKTKLSIEKAICNSYEMTFVYNLEKEYLDKSKTIDKKGDVKKKADEIAKQKQNCKDNADCIKQSMIFAVDYWAGFLNTNGVTSQTYQQMTDTRKADNELKKATFEKSQKEAAEKTAAELKIKQDEVSQKSTFAVNSQNNKPELNSTITASNTVNVNTATPQLNSNKNEPPTLKNNSSDDNLNGVSNTSKYSNKKFQMPILNSSDFVFDIEAKFSPDEVAKQCHDYQMIINNNFSKEYFVAEKAGDKDTAVSILKKEADAGNLNAAALLSVNFLLDGKYKNIELAEKYARIGAAKNNPYALETLAQIAHDREDDESAFLLEKYAAQNCLVRALDQVGASYLYGFNPVSMVKDNNIKIDLSIAKRIYSIFWYYDYANNAEKVFADNQWYYAALRYALEHTDGVKLKDVDRPKTGSLIGETDRMKFDYRGSSDSIGDGNLLNISCSVFGVIQTLALMGDLSEHLYPNNYNEAKMGLNCIRFIGEYSFKGDEKEFINNITLYFYGDMVPSYYKNFMANPSYSQWLEISSRLKGGFSIMTLIAKKRLGSKQLSYENEYFCLKYHGGIVPGKCSNNEVPQISKYE